MPNAMHSLRTKDCAAFGSAGTDHRASTCSFHPGTEPVGTGAFHLGRLISSFHGWFVLNIYCRLSLSPMGKTWKHCYFSIFRPGENLSLHRV